MKTHTNLSKALSYFFNDAKLILSLTDEAENTAENIDDTPLAACLNKYLQNKTSSCGWASENQTSTENLCKLLEETSLEAKAADQGFDSPGPLLKQFKTANGQYAVLCVTANALLP